MKIIIEAATLEELKSLLGQLTSNTASKRNSHIDHLPLDKRTRTALLAEGIETAEDISRMSERELLRIPNLGSKSVAEIRDVLSAFGFS